ncbi:MAG: Ig-like domain-containing protein [Candidatus Paceibacterota bacterium]
MQNIFKQIAKITLLIVALWILPQTALGFGGVDSTLKSGFKGFNIGQSNMVDSAINTASTNKGLMSSGCVPIPSSGGRGVAISFANPLKDSAGYTLKAANVWYTCVPGSSFWDATESYLTYYGDGSYSGQIGSCQKLGTATSLSYNWSINNYAGYVCKIWVAFSRTETCAAQPSDVANIYSRPFRICGAPLVKNKSYSNALGTCNTQTGKVDSVEVCGYITDTGNGGSISSCKIVFGGVSYTGTYDSVAKDCCAAIKGLQKGSTYKFRAYATNNSGTEGNAGTDTIITTISTCSIASKSVKVTTPLISNVTKTSAHFEADAWLEDSTGAKSALTSDYSGLFRVIGGGKTLDFDSTKKSGTSYTYQSDGSNLAAGTSYEVYFVVKEISTGKVTLSSAGKFNTPQAAGPSLSIAAVGTPTCGTYPNCNYSGQFKITLKDGSGNPLSGYVTVTTPRGSSYEVKTASDGTYTITITNLASLTTTYTVKVDYGTATAQATIDPRTVCANCKEAPPTDTYYSCYNYADGNGQYCDKIALASCTGRTCYKNDSTCANTCKKPTTCDKNGICDAGETQTNCPSDCNKYYGCSNTNGCQLITSLNDKLLCASNGLSSTNQICYANDSTCQNACAKDMSWCDVSGVCKTSFISEQACRNEYGTCYAGKYCGGTSYYDKDSRCVIKKDLSWCDTNGICQTAYLAEGTCRDEHGSCILGKYCGGTSYYDKNSKCVQKGNYSYCSASGACIPMQNVAKAACEDEAGAGNCKDGLYCGGTSYTANSMCVQKANYSYCSSLGTCVQMPNVLKAACEDEAGVGNCKTGLYCGGTSNYDKDSKCVVKKDMSWCASGICQTAYIAEGTCRDEHGSCILGKYCGGTSYYDKDSKCVQKGNYSYCNTAGGCVPMANVIKKACEDEAGAGNCKDGLYCGGTLYTASSMCVQKANYSYCNISGVCVQMPNVIKKACEDEAGVGNCKDGLYCGGTSYTANSMCAQKANYSYCSVNGTCVPMSNVLKKACEDEAGVGNCKTGLYCGGTSQYDMNAACESPKLLSWCQYDASLGKTQCKSATIRESLCRNEHGTCWPGQYCSKISAVDPNAQCSGEQKGDYSYCASTGKCISMPGVYKIACEDEAGKGNCINGLYCGGSSSDKDLRCGGGYSIKITRDPAFAEKCTRCKFEGWYVITLTKGTQPVGGGYVKISMPDNPSYYPTNIPTDYQGQAKVYITDIKDFTRTYTFKAEYGPDNATITIDPRNLCGGCASLGNYSYCDAYGKCLVMNNVYKKACEDEAGAGNCKDGSYCGGTSFADANSKCTGYFACGPKCMQVYDLSAINSCKATGKLPDGNKCYTNGSCNKECRVPGGVVVNVDATKTGDCTADVKLSFACEGEDSICQGQTKGTGLISNFVLYGGRSIAYDGAAPSGATLIPSGQDTIIAQNIGILTSDSAAKTVIYKVKCTSDFCRFPGQIFYEPGSSVLGNVLGRRYISSPVEFENCAQRGNYSYCNAQGSCINMPNVYKKACEDEAGVGNCMPVAYCGGSVASPNGICRQEQKGNYSYCNSLGSCIQMSNVYKKACEDEAGVGNCKDGLYCGGNSITANQQCGNKGPMAFSKCIVQNHCIDITEKPGVDIYCDVLTMGKYTLDNAVVNITLFDAQGRKIATKRAGETIGNPTQYTARFSDLALNTKYLYELDANNEGGLSSNFTTPADCKTTGECQVASGMNLSTNCKVPLGSEATGRCVKVLMKFVPFNGKPIFGQNVSMDVLYMQNGRIVRTTAPAFWNINTQTPGYSITISGISVASGETINVRLPNYTIGTTPNILTSNPFTFSFGKYTVQTFTSDTGRTVVSGTAFLPLSMRIKHCCGNGICDAAKGETAANCSKDCANQPNLHMTASFSDIRCADGKNFSAKVNVNLKEAAIAEKFISGAKISYAIPGTIFSNFVEISSPTDSLGNTWISMSAPITTYTGKEIQFKYNDAQTNLSFAAIEEACKNWQGNYTIKAWMTDVKCLDTQTGKYQANIKAQVFDANGKLVQDAWPEFNLGPSRFQGIEHPTVSNGYTSTLLGLVNDDASISVDVSYKNAKVSVNPSLEAKNCLSACVGDFDNEALQIKAIAPATCINGKLTLTGEVISATGKIKDAWFNVSGFTGRAMEPLHVSQMPTKANPVFTYTGDCSNLKEGQLYFVEAAAQDCKTAVAKGGIQFIPKKEGASVLLKFVGSKIDKVSAAGIKPESAEGSITFSITAIGGDAYLPIRASVAPSAYSFSVKTSSGENHPKFDSTIGCDAEIKGDYYLVREGTTKKCAVAFAFTAFKNAFYQATIDHISWNTGATDLFYQESTLKDSLGTFPLNSQFKTQMIYLVSGAAEASGKIVRADVVTFGKDDCTQELNISLTCSLKADTCRNTSIKLFLNPDVVDTSASGNIVEVPVNDFQDQTIVKYQVKVKKNSGAILLAGKSSAAASGQTVVQLVNGATNFNAQGCEIIRQCIKEGEAKVVGAGDDLPCCTGLVEFYNDSDVVCEKCGKDGQSPLTGAGKCCEGFELKNDVCVKKVDISACIKEGEVVKANQTCCEKLAPIAQGLTGIKKCTNTCGHGDRDNVWQQIDGFKASQRCHNKTSYFLEYNPVCNEYAVSISGPNLDQMKTAQTSFRSEEEADKKAREVVSAWSNNPNYNTIPSCECYNGVGIFYGYQPVNFGANYSLKFKGGNDRFGFDREHSQLNYLKKNIIDALPDEFEHNQCGAGVETKPDCGCSKGCSQVCGKVLSSAGSYDYQTFDDKCQMETAKYILSNEGPCLEAGGLRVVIKSAISGDSGSKMQAQIIGAKAGTAASYKPQFILYPCDNKAIAIEMGRAGTKVDSKGIYSFNPDYLFLKNSGFCVGARIYINGKPVDSANPIPFK